MGDDFAMESFKIGGNALAHSLAKMSNLYLIPAKLGKYKYIYNICFISISDTVCNQVTKPLVLNIEREHHDSLSQGN